MAETSSARFQNRRAMLDKEHALNTARNPGDSKYGNALYRNNTHEGRVYSAELTKIEKQLRITSMQIDQQKKQFLTKYAPKEPMLIVVRPPSPRSIQKYEWSQYNLENDFAYGHPKYRGGPRYMDPLKSRVRTPNFRPTIDAFCVQTKKKVNVWEKELLEKEAPKFRSTVMPSYPLSTSEVRDLIKTLEYHRLALDEARKKKPKREAKRRQKKAASSPGSRKTDRDSVTTPWQFVTDGSTSNGPLVADPAKDEKREVDSKRSRARTNSRNGTDVHTVTFSLSKDNGSRKKVRQNNDNVKRPSRRSSTSVQRDPAASRKSTVTNPTTTTTGYSNDTPNNIHKKLSTNATCVVRRDSNPAVGGSQPTNNPNTNTEHPVTFSRIQRSAHKGSRPAKVRRDGQVDSPTPGADDNGVKKKSGMTLILEAAMDGMSSTASEGVNT
ncbi:hypothetical protein LSH36_719g01017 [Paralvinella palmiformis]|uniref:Uncharacterized protein n=1 Tax=Paralvinella palmiformis TaxID=53620 RepID=A0AAD9MV28_9ANNE|nr:hypothetical protein LSH36_719g01017 [Paralvinella palmiformis]